MTAKEYNNMSVSEKKKEDWMNSKWRPACGWMYILVCLFDFVIAPVLWSVLQSISHGSVNTQWQPLTLQGAGLFHVAMGAIIGVSAYGRTQEKLGGANNGGISLPGNVGTTYTPPGAVQQPTAPAGFGATAPSSFGAASYTQAAYTPAPSWNSAPAVDPSQVISGFGGKAAPVIPPFPER
jgi:hypothetical protein